MKNKTKTNSLKSFFQRLFSQNKHPTPPSSVSDGVFITRDPNYKRTEVRSVPVFFISIEETISDEDVNKQLGNSKCFLIGSESIEQPKNTPKTAFSLMAIGKMRESMKEDINEISDECMPGAYAFWKIVSPMLKDPNQMKTLSVAMTQLDAPLSQHCLTTTESSEVVEEETQEGNGFNTSVRTWVTEYKEKIRLKNEVEERDMIVLFNNLRNEYWKVKNQFRSIGRLKSFGKILRKVFFKTENPIFKVNGITMAALIALVEDKELNRTTVYNAIKKYNRLV